MQQVNVPSTNGDFGILANHVPTIACLRPGVVTVIEEGKETRFFGALRRRSGHWLLHALRCSSPAPPSPAIRSTVSSGTVSVNADSTVQVVAEEAVPLAHLDPAAARAGLDRFTQQLATATTDLDKATAEIGVEVHRAMCAALGVAR